MSAYTDNAVLLIAMGVTENQFANAVKNKKNKIVPLIQAEKSAETDKAKGVAIINDILDYVGVLNAGGYDEIARKHNAPPKHVIDLYEEFKATVRAMNTAGDLD